MTSWNVSSMPIGVANAFAFDYSLSHLLGNLMAFVLSHGNCQLLTFQLSVSLSLFMITVVRRLRGKRHSNDMQQGDYFSFKIIIMAVLFAGSMQVKLLDYLDKSGRMHFQDSHYGDLWAHWMLQAKVNFVTNLSACNPLYARVNWSELWQLIKTLIVKPYCMYGVVMLAMFFRKWRKSNVPTAANQEQRERARNYVLEDFLEEHHVSMSDMSNKQTEQQLQQCFAMLESCDHDYERYKREKAKMQAEQQPERDDFMQDIKRLKAQIHRNSDKQRKEREQATSEQPSSLKATTADEKPATETDREQNIEKEEYDDEETASEGSEETLPSKASNSNNKESNNGKRRQTRRDSVVPTANSQIFNLHYMYSFMQMIVFTLIGLTVRKLFFLSFTLGCVIAPTICSKVWYHRQRNIFWSVSLAVFLLSMFDPGLVVSVAYTYICTYITEDLSPDLSLLFYRTYARSTFPRVTQVQQMTWRACSSG